MGKFHKELGVKPSFHQMSNWVGIISMIFTVLTSPGVLSHWQLWNQGEAEGSSVFRLGELDPLPDVFYCTIWGEFNSVRVWRRASTTRAFLCGVGLETGAAWKEILAIREVVPAEIIRNLGGSWQPGQPWEALDHLLRPPVVMGLENVSLFYSGIRSNS